MEIYSRCIFSSSTGIRTFTLFYFILFLFRPTSESADDPPIPYMIPWCGE